MFIKMIIFRYVLTSYVSEHFNVIRSCETKIKPSSSIHVVRNGRIFFLSE